MSSFYGNGSIATANNNSSLDNSIMIINVTLFNDNESTGFILDTTAQEIIDHCETQSIVLKFADNAQTLIAPAFFISFSENEFALKCFEDSGNIITFSTQLLTDYPVFLFNSNNDNESLPAS